MSATGDRAAREAGQTLIEMLVALAILGLIAGIAAPVLSSLLARRALVEASGTLALGLAEARAEAVAGGAPVRIELVAATGGGARLVTSPAGHDHPLPEGVSLDWPRDGLTVYADGTATVWDGALAIKGTRRAFRIDSVHARAEFGA